MWIGLAGAGILTLIFVYIARYSVMHVDEDYRPLQQGDATLPASPILDHGSPFRHGCDDTLYE
jgi:hypothetical protein